MKWSAKPQAAQRESPVVPHETPRGRRNVSRRRRGRFSGADRWGDRSHPGAGSAREERSLLLEDLAVDGHEVVLAKAVRLLSTVADPAAAARTSFPTAAEQSTQRPHRQSRLEGIPALGLDGLGG